MDRKTKGSKGGVGIKFSKDRDRRGWKLVEAASAGNADGVKDLLLKGADPHHLNDSALREATKRGKKDVVKTLLRAGADPFGGTADMSGDSIGALGVAAFNGDRDLIELFAAHKNNQGEKSHPELMLAAWASIGRLDKVQEALAKSPKPDINGINGIAIKFAARNGQTETVLALIKAGANPATDGGYPYWAALQQENLRTLNVLLKNSPLKELTCLDFSDRESRKALLPMLQKEIQTRRLKIEAKKLREAGNELEP